MKTATIIGTRPEAIKLYKLTKMLDNNIIVSTGQHKELLDSTLNSLGISPDVNLSVMETNQTLASLTSKIINSMTEFLLKENPDLIFVHGDTTTAFASSLAAFYLKIKIAHVEAGLRTNDKTSPYPEESNRQMIARIADYHFAPIEQNKINLQNENINSNIFVTGNTGIDTLLDFSNINVFPEKLKFIENHLNNFILVTGHRRENFGDGFNNICNAIKQIALKYPNLNIIYPVHLNPNVQKPVNNILSNIKNVLLIKPQEYREFVWLMKKCKFILTDSGGIQEEAPSLNKPVLIMRDNSERMEAIQAGCAKLVGIDIANIVNSSIELIENNNVFNKMSNVINPFGDGLASKRILEIIR